MSKRVWKNGLALLLLSLGSATQVAAGKPTSSRAIHEGAPSLRASMPADSDGVAIYRAALRAKGTKIMVSTEKKWLWLVSGRDTLVSAPVAIGMGNTFEYKGRVTRFHTPRGRRVVQLKEENPIWTVPEWHYYEKAGKLGYDVVELKKDEPYLLSDGTWIEVRDGEVGRVNRFGNWAAFSRDFEITLEGKLFMPPMGTTQRQVTDALGPYKLDMGEGYLIHGTHVYTQDSIGTAASHGCVRMRNEDLTILYQLAPKGTPVFIF